MFTPQKLSYALNALEPFISARTMDFHYNKHYMGYIAKLNELTTGTVWQNMPLEQIIRDSRHLDTPLIYNNAAQVWNHEFFFSHIAPNRPRISLKLLNEHFGSLADFKRRFKEQALARFGSGYCWLTDQDGLWQITSAANADNPIALDLGKPLLGIDVWEHAYYLDYQNSRADFVDAYLNNLVFPQEAG